MEKNGCDISPGANLMYANLRYANLSGVNLSDADLYNADLRDADLRGADLRDTNLCNASLLGANLCDTCLDPANKAGESLDTLRSAGFHVLNGYVYGWRTKKSQHCSNAKYTPGSIHIASVFSTCRETDCHPGIYLASYRWLNKNYTTSEYVQCRCRIEDLIMAGDKFRCRKLEIKPVGGWKQAVKLEREVQE